MVGNESYQVGYSATRRKRRKRRGEHENDYDEIVIVILCQGHESQTLKLLRMSISINITLVHGWQGRDYGPCSLVFEDVSGKNSLLKQLGLQLAKECKS